MIFNRLIYIVFTLCIVCFNTSYAQTIIFSDAGPYDYTGIDVPASESFNADISNCTSVSISYDFNFSLPWEGSGNMETCDECPGCGCDPSNSIDGGCTPCWDYLQGIMQIDGSTVFEDLIGDSGTTNADQSGTVSSGFICTDGASNVDLELNTNTWASNETATFSNIVIMCYQATTISIDTDSDICEGQNVNLEGEALNNSHVDTWMWTTDGGSSIDNDASQNTFATGATDGETYTLTTTDANGCSSTISETISLSPSPEGSIDQSSNGELCFGECTDISFDFLGGSAPYDLDLTFTISGVGFPIDFNAPGFAASDEITICYDITGPFPSFEPTTLTINVPEIAAGQSGTFLINDFTDSNGCQGLVTGGGFNVSFLDTPEANDAFLEACDEGGGLATFDLTEMDNDINGGSGETVRYYGDPGLNTEIFSPYFSPSSVIYATVSNGDCTSPPEPVNLIVLQNGDAGNVELYCSEIGSTNCTICDDDGTLGEMIDIVFVFDDPSLQHIVKLNYTDINGSTEVTYTLNPNQTILSFTVTGSTSFELLEVTEGDGCVDDTDLGDLVTVNYTLSPTLDPIGPLSACGSISLPAITGTNLTGSEMYYTQTNQGGDSYAVGEIITSSIDLFVYAGVPDCFDEIMVEVEILPGTTFDAPNDTMSCGPYILPEITGTGINPTSAYYTMPGGSGNIFIPGNSVISNTTLYIYDPAASCSSNEPSFQITINNQPTIDVIDIDTCGTYELPIITGTFLPGNESYYSEPNGMGIEFMVGDTVFTTDTIYAFANNNDCIADEEIIIKIGEGPTAGVGDTISLCSTTGPIIVNLPLLLSEPADTLGMWSDDMGILMDDTDSTMVDISGITGEINFMYVIENIECGNDTSHLQINIREQLDAGGEDLLVGCEDEFNTIDLNAFWNIVGIEDTIIVLGGAAIDVTNPNSVNIADLAPGIYNLQYIVGLMDTICTPDTANLIIQIDELFDAGEDVPTTTCVGNIVFLENVLVGNNTIGVFGDPNETGALNVNEVDSGILGVGTFTFTHTVPSNGSCPGETIEITIEVTNDVTAGLAVQDTICFTEEVNLFDYLNGASQGGTFYDADNGNQEITGGIRIIDAWPTLPNGTPIIITSIYTVGDGIDCPESSATIELTILPEPVIELDAIQSTVCDSILNVEINYTYLEGFDFTIVIEGPLAELPISIPFDGSTPPQLAASDLLSLEINLNDYNLPKEIEYTISIGTVSRGNCIAEIIDIPDTFTIGRQDTLLVNDMICGAQSVTYNGQIYNASNPTDTIVIPRASQCDSVIIIDLNILEPATSLINSTLCTGQSITVGGTVYDETNPSGEYILFDGSVNGCDSTVVIDLTFGDASINDEIHDICTGEELVFNNIIYDENNLMGSDTLFGGSIGGCDSIINVNLTLTSVSMGIEETTTCDLLYSVMVNGETYDFSNTQGVQTILNGSSNGCDSIVTINLTYLDPALGIEDRDLCPGETIMVNGNIYDENQLTGSETFIGGTSNGCDSIVNINLTLLPIPEGDFINSSCDEDYEFTINGNVYNINNLSGTELIANGASNGCDSLVNILLSFDGITATSELIQPTCIDPSNGQVIINGITGTAPHTYIDESGASTLIESFPFTIENLSGDGTLDITDADGCHNIVTYSFQDFSEPVLTSDIIDNQIIVNGITNDEINSISWTPDSGLSCTDCLNPVYNVTEDTEYTITISYSEGCEVSLSILVTVVEPPKIPIYTIPNVFSPNGDGNNDVFYIVPNDVASSQIVSMTIFDRWGNQMYRRENYINVIGEGWDGTFNGEELNPGVYVYLIEVLENDAILPFYGDVTIVK